MIDTQEEIERLNALYPGTTLTKLAWGSVVRVPGVKLPSGWRAFVVTKKATSYSVETKHPASPPDRCTMLLYLPAGYPGASPRHFWTEENIRSKRGWDAPYYSRDRDVSIPTYDGPVGTHFFWSPQAWNPNMDGVIRYFYTMRYRFKVAFDGGRLYAPMQA